MPSNALPWNQKRMEADVRYRLLGSSGLRVSEFALGTMTFGERRSWGIDERAARLIMDKFAEAGGTFFDTANIEGYSDRPVEVQADDC